MKKIAIIGVGPRGLSALESFIKHLSNQNKKAAITLFETAENPGAGEIWNIDQPNTNWLNISERDLKELPNRPKIKYDNIILPEFETYHKWACVNLDTKTPDVFPARNKIGSYFKERFSSLAVPLIAVKKIELQKTKIINVSKNKNYFTLTDQSLNKYQFDEVLLTIGHQPTEDSDQLKKWTHYSKEEPSVLLVKDAYPIKKYLNSKLISSENNIAIRGMGLSMIDILRALTIQKGGHFEIINPSTYQSIFKSGKNTPKKIIPFSLDGKLAVPKPLNINIDNLFKPSEEEFKEFSKSLIEVTSGNVEAKDTHFFKNAIAKISSGIFIKLPSKVKTDNYSIEQIHDTIINWLTDEDFQHPLLAKNKKDPKKTIQSYINMAINIAPMSLDYCVGQVWRHCHSVMYNAFSHAKIEEDVLYLAIALYDRMKRYSYGPPVESMQQIIALINADILVLDYINNPEIKLSSEGWILSKHEKSITARVMINSVLNSPKLLKVNSPIIKGLLSDELISPFHSKLGIETDKNASVITEEDKKIKSLAVLGRLAKGSVLGVDSISACFGERVEKWAEETAKRL
ncbi:FAD/NAD(P)-binding protein [Joostella sp.]|uniref:FAD/NAD(P)-binding protein n=1 Tax=Joostella sp. TaxID=2231138 RepID=UPI003A92D299